MKNANKILKAIALFCAIISICTAIYFPCSALIENTRASMGGQAEAYTAPEQTKPADTYAYGTYPSVEYLEGRYGYTFYELEEPIYHRCTMNTSVSYWYTHYYEMESGEKIYFSVV